LDPSQEGGVGGSPESSMLYRAGRTEVTLRPKGGGRIGSPPQTTGSCKAEGTRGSQDRTTPKGSAR
jgi:hypothetical protein